MPAAGGVSSEDQQARGRVPYALAGAALRESFARARRAGIGKQAWSVLSVIAEQTASYSRLSERIYVARISAATGISERRVRELANALEQARCIERVRSRGRYPSSYSLVLPDEKRRELETMLAGEQGRERQYGSAVGTDTLPRGRQPSEEGVREAAAGAPEPEEFAESVSRLHGAPTRGKQRAEWLRAYREAPQGFLRTLEAAKQGQKPPALLTAKLRSGEHLSYEDASTYMLQVYDPNESDPRLEGPYGGEQARRRRTELIAQGMDVATLRESS
jgi:hypothetical protein